MGEWSKTVGEFGEKTVENFLRLIGWGETPKNISLDCIKPKVHAEEGKERQTHGIDFYFSYLSPLVDNTRKNVHISSKYTANPYPNSPVRTFKEYVQELAWTIDCFRHSEKKQEYFSNLRGYKHTEDVGVLFWLSNDGSTYDDLINKVANSNISLEGPIHSLFVVDNKRVEFIYQALRHSQSNYNGYSVDFFYPSTGKNIIPVNKKNYGSMLPVEYINTSVLPIRVQNSHGTTGLLLFSIEPYSGEDLKRLMGLTQELSKSWSGFVEISFPDFNSLSHGDSVRAIKSMFLNDGLIDNITVTSFSNSFTNINQ